MTEISLCMIVKDEEMNIAQCLDSAKDLVDDIVIADTGSEDRTKEIALRYTGKVYDYPWMNDFSQARNFSISKAKNDVILVLDADERVVTCDTSEVLSEIEKNPNKIGKLLFINEFTRQGESYQELERLGRIFSKKCYIYSGKIHEQLIPIAHTEKEFYEIPITILHSGYDGNLETRKKKALRNICLLQEALNTLPENPYLLYQIGRSYYMMEEYEDAKNYLGQALGYDLDIRLEYVQDLVELYGYSLINTNQYETAMTMLNLYDEFSISADFIFLIALIHMNNGFFQEAVSEFLKATKFKNCKIKGVNDYLAYYNIGVIYECFGDRTEALYYYYKCKNYQRALERMKQLK